MAERTKHRYARISRRMESDERVRRLTRPQPCGLSLLRWLLLCKQATSLPGVICMGPAAIAEANKWPVQQLRQPLAELLREGLIEVDEDACLLWLPGACKHNPPANANAVRSWEKPWDEVPECTLKTRIYEHLHGYMANRKNTDKVNWLELFEEVCGKPGDNRYGTVAATVELTVAPTVAATLDCTRTRTVARTRDVVVRARERTHEQPRPQQRPDNITPTSSPAATISPKPIRPKPTDNGKPYTPLPELERMLADGELDPRAMVIIRALFAVPKFAAVLRRPEQLSSVAADALRRYLGDELPDDVFTTAVNAAALKLPDDHATEQAIRDMLGRRLYYAVKDWKAAKRNKDPQDRPPGWQYEEPEI